ncbi:hypothetical protein [Roseibium aestuarii]|uniref:Uncharacterized protein n=1 Tax=Roseibium aestuarii TaxID=2600299 RepID=A0ABW4K3N0_9HYPH|nr:hypothetical protein [Roseibium aestuarii]
MPSISDTSAAASSYNVRSQLATNAIRDSAQEERQVADRLQDQQNTQEQQRRQSRQIPGLGNAVDISA